MKQIRPDCDADVVDSHPHAHIIFVNGEGEKQIQWLNQMLKWSSESNTRKNEADKNN